MLIEKLNELNALSNYRTIIPSLTTLPPMSSCLNSFLDSLLLLLNCLLRLLSLNFNCLSLWLLLLCYNWLGFNYYLCHWLSIRVSGLFLVKSHRHLLLLLLLLLGLLCLYNCFCLVLRLVLWLLLNYSLRVILHFCLLHFLLLLYWGINNLALSECAWCFCL